MENLHGNMHVCACLKFTCKYKTCMFSPFSATFYPHYIIMVRGLYIVISVIDQL